MDKGFYGKIRVNLATHLDNVEAGSPLLIMRRNTKTHEVREAAVIVSKAEYDRLISLDKA